MDDFDPLTTRRHPTAWWLEQLEALGIPCGPVLDHAELFAHPQIAARRMVEEVDHPTAGRIRTLGLPVKLSETPGSIRAPAPRLDEHDAEIRAEAARLRVARTARQGNE